MVLNDIIITEKTTILLQMQMEDEKVCCICIDTLAGCRVIPFCNHAMCYSCFIQLMINHKQVLCPVCRQSLTELPKPIPEYDFVLVKKEPDWPTPLENSFEFIRLAKRKGVWKLGYNILLEQGYITQHDNYKNEIRRRLNIDFCYFLENNKDIKIPYDMRPYSQYNRFMFYRDSYNRENIDNLITTAMAFDKYQYISNDEKIKFKILELQEKCTWYIKIYKLIKENIESGKQIALVAKLYFIIDYIENIMCTNDSNPEYLKTLNNAPLEIHWKSLAIEDYKRYKALETQEPRT